MKVFDYKFLILLALSLIVYFLYRELENLRSKMNNVTEKIDDVNETFSNITKTVQVHQKAILLITNKSKNLLENKKKLKKSIKKTLEEYKDYKEDKEEIIQILLPNPPMQKLKQEDNISVNVELPNSSCNLTTIDSESYSNTSEQIEIYSNDDDKISLASEEGKKNHMVEIEGTNGGLKFELNYTSVPPNTPQDIDLIDESNEESPMTKEQPTISELMRNKLPELQDMAEKMEISLLKDVNGKEKRKTKLELAEDILVKL
jgi:hypothetical protein